eukprot:TRINITY_DN6002_c0_g1_i1.p1 TRINITY_DN6002_c0_g1~~TRINITY_DN6002_c0_g1_i1.p1  ORF type:complete len:241 (-),score=48.20 TRINITY_DN6002_c0_g1_i1:27-749(-)
MSWGNAIEFTSGIREYVGRITLKKLMEQFGEVEVCHIGTRGVDYPFVRFQNKASADAALKAAQAGRIFLDGQPLTADWKGATKKPEPKSATPMLSDDPSRGRRERDRDMPRGADEDPNAQGMRALARASRSSEDAAVRRQRDLGRVPPRQPAGGDMRALANVAGGGGGAGGRRRRSPSSYSDSRSPSRSRSRQKEKAPAAPAAAAPPAAPPASATKASSGREGRGRSRGRGGDRDRDRRR